MSAAGGVGEGAAGWSWLRRIMHNAQGTVATLLRPPRRSVAWPSASTMATGAALAAAAVVASMIFLDARAIAAVAHLPQRLIAAFDDFTDYGRSGVFLWPIGIAMLVLAALDTPAMPRFSRLVLAAWAVRLGFIFTAIAVPSLFVTILKRLIGRARPSVSGSDVWTYHPFAWQPGYASLPSGHDTTAFAAMIAIGALFPQARALMWIYAVLIAVSRLVLVAHYPSDLIAGAVVGAAGALLVRNWFASRGLGFLVAPGGAIRPMSGPSWRRIVKAIARRSQSA
jgi:undecaprenyl-diphosphatase